jgi:HEAT repeat protein
MALTLQQLRLALGGGEPNYAALARSGQGILPALSQLVADRNPVVAAAAATLAGMVGGAAALPVLARASAVASASVRSAAAASLSGISDPRAAALVGKLLADQDKGVRKFAVKAAAARQNPALAAKVAQISKQDPHKHLRLLAARALSRSRVG